MYTRTAISIFLSFMMFNLLFAEESQSNRLKATHISGKYYMLIGGDVNVGVSAGEDGILIIDDHYNTMTDEVRKALGEIGSDKPVFIVNTHLHGDHTGGNEALGKDSHIIAHKNVRKRFSTQRGGWSKTRSKMKKVGLPVITFDEGLSLHFNGEEIKVIHFSNGHTDGDAIVHFTKSKIVHLSDQYFEGRFPVIDTRNGGNAANFIENIGKIIEMFSDDVKFVPGHGNVTNRDALKEYHSMLKETAKIVRDQMRANRNLDDIIKKGFPKKYNKWIWQYVSVERWIRNIYLGYEN